MKLNHNKSNQILVGENRSILGLTQNHNPIMTLTNSSWRQTETSVL